MWTTSVVAILASGQARAVALEDPAEAHRTPALAHPGQAAMIRQRRVQAVAAEPADRQIDLSRAHAPVVDEAEEEAREHEADGHRGIDARPPGRGFVERFSIRRNRFRIHHVWLL